MSQPNPILNRRNSNFIQWNCQGIRNKKDELLEIIQVHTPSIIAIQESKLWNNSEFRIPNYVLHRQDGHYNRTPHGGVALCIHHSFPYQVIPLQSNFQAVAIRIQLQTLITVCSIYVPRSTSIDEATLLQLIEQLPPPFLIMGDFNSYNTLWGDNVTDARGRVLEDVITQLQLNVMNDGSPTRITTHSETCIDVTIASPRLTPLLQWSVAASTFDSDHNPLLITLVGSELGEVGSTRLNIKRADWGAFTSHRAFDNIPENPTEHPADLVEDLHRRIKQASVSSIPEYTVQKFFPKPFWTNELTDSRRKRETMYRKFRRNKSIENTNNWKKARAEHRQLLTKTKREYWKNLASSFSIETPMSKIYENIRKINGRSPRTTHILSEEGRIFSTKPEIVNKLAETFSKISDSSNYSPQFRIHKQKLERQPLDFTSGNTEPYNMPITISELEKAINGTKNTAPGPDQIFYQMLRHLPDHAKTYLLAIFNRIFTESIYPEKWRQANVIAFPKPGKDHSNPTNYRPIALTSCISKTIERILNNRLYDFLIMHKKIAQIQCGCRKCRSTIDHLVRLESMIRSGFANHEHVVSIFFDLQKAYDTTWKWGIMRDLHKMGLRGRLPMFIREFLSHRSFRVVNGEFTSDSYPQEEGVPQGSVLSVTLFAIKINELANILPHDPRLHSSLYVDDFQLSYRHSSLTTIGEKLQNCLNIISEWSNKNGFTFSFSKTKAVHFSLIPGLHLPPDLYLYNQLIEYKPTFKFLGMTWDNKLTWLPHITALKNSTKKMVGMLKSISAQEWGGDKHTLRHLYQIFIRPKIDYGSIVYHSAPRTTSNLLEPIINDCLRMITGCFKSTPTESLKVIANEPPLSLRRDLLTLKYFIKTKSQFSNPAQRVVTNHSERLLFQNRNITPSFGTRAFDLLNSINIETNLILPEFSYTLLNISVPTWNTRTISINRDLSIYQKAVTSNTVYQHLFAELVHNKYNGFSQYYTDGSKTENGVGAAVIGPNDAKTATLPAIASIFTAELHAISMAIELAGRDNNSNVVFFTDSLSALSSLTDKSTDHPLSRRIQHKLHDLLTEKEIEICWIPGHAGIAGNDAADSAAKIATNNHPDAIRIPYSDWFPIFKEKIHEKWKNRWQSRQEKLRSVKDVPGNWKMIRCPRREEVIINRLRAGHTWLTHSYLMNNHPELPPECPLCQEGMLDVPHILLHCSELQQERRIYLNINEDQPPPTLMKLLGDEIKVERIINFLKAINAFDKI